MRYLTIFRVMMGMLLLMGALPGQIGEGPMITEHLDQLRIEEGWYSLEELLEKGAVLFSTKFNRFDGRGRPAATGAGQPTKRDPRNARDFLRTSGPDSGSCAACHNEPRVGGAGDFVANVFVLAQVLDPPTDSVAPEFSNERNTLGMFGAGAIEMLAREMTAELISIREGARREALDKGREVTRLLRTKGVDFGWITARPDGSLDTSGVQGVDADLIIRPFHQKGVAVSLREFTVNAFNHHHGMQAVERFGRERTGSDDFDEDGVADELTVGDITAVTLFQAALAIPGQVIPNDPSRARAIVRGERLFELIGCGSCHRPQLFLENPYYSEPNPYNPEGTLRPEEVTRPVVFDLTAQGQLPRLERTPDGRAVVRAFTDLKRHNLCDDELRHFCNELLVQGGVPREEFLTRKLWDVGSSAPFGHRGDLSTLGEAIFYHGGEARAARDAFLQLPERSRNEVLEFLKSLQVLPEGAPGLVVDENGELTVKPRLPALPAEGWVRGARPGSGEG